MIECVLSLSGHCLPSCYLGPSCKYTEAEDSVCVYVSLAELYLQSEKQTLLIMEDYVCRNDQKVMTK